MPKASSSMITLTQAASNWSAVMRPFSKSLNWDITRICLSWSLSLNLISFFLIASYTFLGSVKSVLSCLARFISFSYTREREPFKQLDNTLSISTSGIPAPSFAKPQSLSNFS